MLECVLLMLSAKRGEGRVAGAAEIEEDDDGQAMIERIDKEASWAGSGRTPAEHREEGRREKERESERERRAHLPSVDRQVGVVEAPVERLGCDGLVGRVVVRREVLMRERLRRVDALARVEHEHLLEEVERLRVGAAELLREGDALAFGERLHEAESLRAVVRERQCELLKAQARAARVDELARWARGERGDARSPSRSSG